MATLYLSDWKTDVSLTSKHLDVREITEDGGRSALMRRIPLEDVERVVVVGWRSHISTAVFREMLRRDIPVCMTLRNGRFLGLFAPVRDGDANLRIRQYQMHESAWAVAAAGRLVHAKIINSRRVLQKMMAGRDDLDLQPIRQALAQLEQLAQRAKESECVEEIRGYEGMGAALYFKHLASFFPDNMPFNGRSRRPPKDEANALLSWTYTIVMGEIRTAVCALGLDPCIGVLHSIEYGRPSLVLDLMEPFRAPLCDLFVLRLINLGIIQPEDFERNEENGGFLMKRDAMKKYFLHYEQRMERLFKRQGDGDHVTFRRVFQDVIQDYIKAIKGERECRPFYMP
jgi:CRISPR-associated protein Cas1